MLAPSWQAQAPERCRSGLQGLSFCGPGEVADPAGDVDGVRAQPLVAACDQGHLHRRLHRFLSGGKPGGRAGVQLIHLPARAASAPRSRWYQASAAWRHILSARFPIRFASARARGVSFPPGGGETGTLDDLHHQVAGTASRRRRALGAAPPGWPGSVDLQVKRADHRSHCRCRWVSPPRPRDRQAGVMRPIVAAFVRLPDLAYEVNVGLPGRGAGRTPWERPPVRFDHRCFRAPADR
jgi:hypothetical protein